MLYPLEFFHSTPQSELCYQDTPTSHFSLDEFLHGRPPWGILKSTGKHKQRKKLIIADWTAKNGSRTKMKNLKRAIAALIADGYSVSIWKNNQVLPLSSSQLSDLDTLLTQGVMEPTHPDEIIQIAVRQHNWARDAVHVLDDYWLDHLLGNGERAPRQIHLHHVMSLNETERNQIFAILNKAKPPLTHIIHNAYSTPANQTLNQIRNVFPHATVIKKYQSIRLRTSELIELLHGESIAHEGYTIQWDDLAELQECTIQGGSLTRAQLQAVMANKKKFKKLSLYRVALPEGIPTDPQLVKHVNTLNICFCNLSTTDLPALLSHATELSTLNLSGCTQLPTYFPLTANHLVNLTQLNLHESHITAIGLQSLLAATCNLKKLALGGCPHLSGDIMLPDGCLHLLEELTLPAGNMSSNSMCALLTASAATLKKLYLMGNKEQEATNQVPGIFLQKLEEFGASHRNFSIQNLGALITRATPNLKKLDLFHCNNLDGYFALPQNCLPNLSEVSLNYCNITTPNLQTLLAATPNLTKLDLRGCKNLQGDLVLPAGSLPHLVECYFSESGLSDNDIQVLFRAAPNLKHMNRIKDSEPPPRNSEHRNIADASIERATTYRPTSEHAHFQFTGKNSMKNQAMIVEKLCQYLTLSKQYPELIPKLQDGICASLTHYFITQSPDDWLQYIDQVQQWNGRAETFNPTILHFFDTLLAYLTSKKLRNHDPLHYVGDNLPSLLRVCRTPCLLTNPRHQIAILPSEWNADTWIVYDPNDKKGAQEVKKSHLAQTIYDYLGPLVSVHSNSQSVPPSIINPEEFIRYGGLISLCRCTNAAEMLAQIPDETSYSQESLDGILFRDVAGIPAWVLGIKTPAITLFTLQLLQQFFNKNPEDYAEKLKSSLEVLLPTQKEELANGILACYPKNLDRSQYHQLLHLINDTPSALHYETLLETWCQTKPKASTLSEYCDQCIQIDASKKRLIELDSPSTLQAMHWALRHHCQESDRSLFYIHSPDDLICRAPFIKQIGNQGILHKGPGGPLYDFLQAARADKPPVLLVNYERFSPAEIASFHALLDPERRADGTPLPDDTLVIGLTTPDGYHESDFLSRFDAKETCPISSDALAKFIPRLPMAKKEENTVVDEVINLFHAPDWKERLLGRWVLSRDSLVFEEGALIHALKNGARRIEIKNGLWQNEAFQHFWREARFQGYFSYAGSTIPFPPYFTLYSSHGYDWTILKQHVRAESGIADDGPALNPTRLNEFISRYAFDEATGTLEKKEGLIEEAARHTNELRVNLTRALTIDEWAMVLTSCQEHGIRLITYTPPLAPTPDWSCTTILPTQIIASTDIDTTLSMLTRASHTDDIVIDVSECKPSDLLRRLEGKITDEDPPRFEFSQSNGVLLTAFNAEAQSKKRIILKGRFSDELADQLAQYLIVRQQEKPPRGQLLLICDRDSQFSCAPMSQHTVTMADKLDCLQHQFPNVNPDLFATLTEHESLSMLKTRVAYLEAHPETQNSDEAWCGLYHLTPNTDVGPFNENTAETEAQAFLQARIQAIHAVWAYAPYVFLTGLSGVGKSTFVEQHLKQAGDALYHGEHQLLDWAKDNTTLGRKILFIDEANLSTRQWSELEGLFHNPPGMLLNGVYHPLSSEHKVVFAGNPCSYGDERQLAPLFQRHGHAVVFQPLPPAHIYVDILKPIFANTRLCSDAATISAHLLEVYRFLCACSETDVLISPRELQMMAMLVCAYQQQHPECDDGLVIAKDVAWKLARFLVPDNKRIEFDNCFKPDIALPNHPLVEHGDYLITPSRHPIRQQLDDLLTLRQWRQHPGNNDAQKYGGLGGMVIEGEPGNGKSELVTSTLHAHGFEEEHDLVNPSAKAKLYYRMPASMGLHEKEKLLLKAFHEGAVVVVDEINSSPMMERLLNSLLMGKTLDNKRPEKPGFMVIGTQNPVTMAGRKITSTALKRRLITTDLPPYPEEEMHMILVSKGVGTSEAKALVQAFEKQAKHALVQHLSPAPTFRDVLRIAENSVLVHQQAIAQQKAAFQAALRREEIRQAIESASQDSYSKLMTGGIGFFQLRRNPPITPDLDLLNELGMFPVWVEA